MNNDKTKFALIIGAVWFLLGFVAVIETNIQFLERVFKIKGMDSVSIIHNIQDIARLLLPFLFGWTVWYFIKTTEKNNRAINSSLYNHAQHIMAIKELYQKDENKKELTGLIDKNELFGVLSPSKEQTTNNYKTRKKTDELMRKNYPHLFDNNGDKIK